MRAAAALRVLIVEDDLVDRLACRRALAAVAGNFVLLDADSGEHGLALALAPVPDTRPDCILLDYHLPDLTGLEFLARLTSDSAGPAIPVMMLTGADSAAVAAEAMRRGARDYLVKDVDGRYLALLPGAIQRLLREQRLIEEKRRAEARFRTLVEQMQAISYIADPAQGGALRYISPQIHMLGFSPTEWLADPDLQAHLIDPEQRDLLLRARQQCLGGGMPLHLEYRMLARNGQAMWFREQAELVLDQHGRPQFMQGLMIDITGTKLAEHALLASQQALRSLAAHQERIKEQERKRIAQEIHDELGGLLTGIKAYISVGLDRLAAAGVATEPLLADAAGLVQEAIETVRRVITDLRPSVLDQLGVWAALEWYAEQVACRSGLRCVCTIGAAASALELDTERSTMVFRIVQESLTNVVRHAEASSVQLQADYADGVLRLCIADDGKGIAPERLLNSESWGILGMHERSRHFNGELTIDSLPGQGTTLLLRLPLPLPPDLKNAS